MCGEALPSWTAWPPAGPQGKGEKCDGWTVASRPVPEVGGGGGGRDGRARPGGTPRRLRQRQHGLLLHRRRRQQGQAGGRHPRPGLRPLDRAEPRAARGGRRVIANLIGGAWRRPDVAALPIYDPATGEVIEQVPLSGAAEVADAAAAASAAHPGWAATPVMERVRLMFRFKGLLEGHFEELAAIVTRHHGKTLDEARGEVRRGIEGGDFACGAPTLLQGRTLRQVASGG